jgi:CheY-like chemotaxis protein
MGKHAGGAPVLIVDDEPAIAAFIADVAREMGYQTLVAANGQEALTLAETAWPCLLITDLMMPSMDGPELIARLRERAGDRPLPVILVTVAAVHAARVPGADAVLAKPFELGALESLLHRLLGTGPAT